MYIKRTIEDKLLLLLEHFPSIAILGPRQVGKTTLAKEIKRRLPRESIYLDLENPVDAGALDHPVEFLNNVSDKVVIIPTSGKWQIYSKFSSPEIFLKF